MANATWCSDFPGDVPGLAPASAVRYTGAMSRFCLLVDVRTHPGAGDLFLERILVAAEAAVREEERCLRFDVARDESDPDAFVLIEVYADAAALEHHHTTPHFLAFQREAGHLVLEKRRRRLELLA